MLMDAGKLERRVFRTYWDDGLLDVFAALAVLLIGATWWLHDLPAMIAIVPALLVPLWAPARKRLIEPRKGVVEFTAGRDRRNKTRLQWLYYLGIALLVLAVELYLFRDRLLRVPLSTAVAGLPAILLGLLAAATMPLTGCVRFFGYAGILVISGVSGAAFDWHPGSILVLAGLVMLAIAGTLLVRFLRQNPVGEEFGA